MNVRMLLLLITFPLISHAQLLSIDDLIYMQKSQDPLKVDSMLLQRDTWYRDIIQMPRSKYEGESYRWFFDPADSTNDLMDRDRIELVDRGHDFSRYILFFVTRADQFSVIKTELARRKYTVIKKGDNGEELLQQGEVVILLVQRGDKQKNTNRYLVLVMAKKDYDHGFMPVR